MKIYFFWYDEYFVDIDKHEKVFTFLHWNAITIITIATFRQKGQTFPVFNIILIVNSGKKNCKIFARYT